MMKLSSPLQGIILVLFVVLGINSTSATRNYNVQNFGAKPNGRTDSTKAFLMAWNAACGSADSTLINVSKGRYLPGSIAFKGQCKSPQITIKIDGIMVAPADYRVLGKSGNWLSFEGVSHVSIICGAPTSQESMQGNEIGKCEFHILNKAAQSSCRIAVGKASEVVPKSKWQITGPLLDVNYILFQIF
ncbi:probable polygalacturonase At2g43860 [Durio zibethinus]|uniref:Probable polygalacturonase At2g43860 n=1 Tax=Durio zibethinus TaxID=66656 RepID=A0A6P5Z6Y5_DURZI|nr:probable polygalacturonase At2g43860 [Durio zibethinus]